MTEWLLPCNPGDYEVDKALRSLPWIEWARNRSLMNVVVGDIAYIYISSPVKAIGWKCEVTDVRVSEGTSLDAEFNKNPDWGVAAEEPVIELKPLREYTRRELVSLDKLRQHGLNKSNRLQGPCKVTEELRNYLYAMEEEEDLGLAENLMRSVENRLNQVPCGAATDVGKNTILYGPPGTGKTRCTVACAVAVIETKPLGEVEREDYAEVKKRFDAYKKVGLIEFTTFHQSFGYEEFVEGIRPVMTGENEGSDLQYRVEPGIFKRFCTTGRSDFDTAWNLLVQEAEKHGNHLTFTRRSGTRFDAEAVDQERFRVNWESERGSHNDLTKSATKGQYENYTYDDRAQLKRGGNLWLFDARQAVIDMLVQNFGLCPSKDFAGKNRVFIIDEINRGNISKIFGELITLIEPAKRLGQPEELCVRLPCSRELFGVPDNVYLLGTMNTADRSIAMLDTALRRRFQFREIQPEPGLLAYVSVEGLSIESLLVNMNRKIAVLYDREHTIGHGYFMPLKDSPTIETLAEIFEHNILPLLGEYFYDDCEKIRLVLGDNKKSDPAEQFILAEPVDCAELFGGSDAGLEDAVSYRINRDAFRRIAAYASI